jgi:uncharacterized phage-associated protein
MLAQGTTGSAPTSRRDWLCGDRHEDRNWLFGEWARALWQGRSGSASGEAHIGGTLSHRPQGGGEALGLMPAPYNAKSVANWFLKRSFEAGRPIDHMKLQKLVFFAHGYYLAATNLNEGEFRPLVDEYFEAWPYGPVLPTVYDEFKEFGRGQINRLGLVYRREFGTNVVATPPENDETFDSVSEYVWNTYASKPSMALSDITHAVRGAWDRARQEAHGLRGKDVPNEYILEDFRTLVRKSD